MSSTPTYPDFFDGDALGYVYTPTEHQKVLEDVCSVAFDAYPTLLDNFIDEHRIPQYVPIVVRVNALEGFNPVLAQRFCLYYDEALERFDEDTVLSWDSDELVQACLEASGAPVYLFKTNTPMLESLQVSMEFEPLWDHRVDT